MTTIAETGTTKVIKGIVIGAYGDMERCEGVLEDIITPEEGGTFMKFHGCPYLFKGFPLNEVIESMGLAKALLSFLPREIISKSFIFSSMVALLFLFNRKRFYYYLNLYFGMIYDRAVVRAGMLPERYNAPTIEIKRAFYVALKNEFGVFDKPLRDYYAAEIKGNTKLLKAVFYAKTIEFMCFFLEIDSAYRLRVQDVLGHRHKDIKGLFDILIKREKDEALIRNWKSLSRIILLFIKINSQSRRIIDNFLLQIDIDEVKLDEADWYFSLRRKGYDFRGISLEERLKEKERIEKEQGFTPWGIVYKNQL